MTKTVAVLGTGIMGSGMARSLLRAGLDVTVWNRSADKAAPLAEDGATVAPDAAAAVAEADVVVTMLFDTDAVLDVMTSALPAMRDDAVWLQTSTVGLAGAAELANLAARRDIVMVDAPVSGTRQPAEKGELVVLAGGPESARDAVAPVLDAIGSRTVWVGERPGDGQRLKLVANAWVLSLLTGTAQAVELASGLGLDPRLFLEAIKGGPVDSVYATMKANAMITGDFAPAFPVNGAAKDAGLILDAMREAGTNDELMAVMRRLLDVTRDAGQGSVDMAAVITAFRTG